MRKIIVVGLSTVLALSASACSLVGGGDPDEPSSAPPSASEPATSAPSASGSTAPAGPTPADPGQPGGGTQLGQAFATRTSLIDGGKATLTIYPISRNQTTSLLNFTLEGDKTGGLGLQVTQALSDYNADAIDSTSDAADGLQLVDGKNAKLYLVASDGNGQCVCSRGLGKVFLEAGQPVVLSATFAAPPADVTSIDVRIPGFGTVKAVPVT